MNFETLKRSREFDRVFRSGRSVACRELVLFAFRKNVARPRVGFCVSKKLGKAVVRNRVRRRLREIYRNYDERFDERWDLVMVARKAATEASFHHLQTIFRRLVRKLNREWKRPASSAARRSS